MRADRNGFFYVINRESGKLVSAQPFVPTNWATGVDMKTGMPIEDPTKRPRLGKWARNVCPNLIGGKNWEPMSYSQQTGLVYIPTFNMCMDIANKEEEYSPGKFYLASELPAPPPPWPPKTNWHQVAAMTAASAMSRLFFETRRRDKELAGEYSPSLLAMSMHMLNVGMYTRPGLLAVGHRFPVLAADQIRDKRYAPTCPDADAWSDLRSACRSSCRRPSPSWWGRTAVRKPACRFHG